MTPEEPKRITALRLLYAEPRPKRHQLCGQHVKYLFAQLDAAKAELELATSIIHDQEVAETRLKETVAIQKSRLALADRLAGAVEAWKSYQRTSENISFDGFVDELKKRADAIVALAAAYLDGGGKKAKHVCPECDAELVHSEERRCPNSDCGFVWKSKPDEPKPCEKCEGTGQVTDGSALYRILVQCPACNGEGKVKP